MCYADTVKKINELAGKKEALYDSYKNDLSDLKKLDMISKRLERLTGDTKDVSKNSRKKIKDLAVENV